MRRYRLLLVAATGIAAVLLGALVFGNLNGNLVYYLTPDEALARHGEFVDGERFQLGGFVRPDSVAETPAGLTFLVSAGTAADSATIRVVHRGSPAQLFQAGIGVVLEGSWLGSAFASDTMIVKHDETYRPPDGKSRAAQGDPR